MTAIGQVKRAVIKAVAEAGCAATAAYGAEELKRYERAVAAVGVRETRITKAGLIGYLGRRTDERTQETAECYGRRMELSVSLDIYAPRTLGAQGCEDAAETVAQALTTALPEGLCLRALHWGEPEWDRTSGMFRLCAQAEYAAFFVAEAAEDETVFTDFVLKGTVKENEQYDP